MIDKSYLETVNLCDLRKRSDLDRSVYLLLVRWVGLRDAKPSMSRGDVHGMYYAAWKDELRWFTNVRFQLNRPEDRESLMDWIVEKVQWIGPPAGNHLMNASIHNFNVEDES